MASITSTRSQHRETETQLVRQFFSILKGFAWLRLQECVKRGDWAAIVTAIQNWDDAALEEEINLLVSYVGGGDASTVRNNIEEDLRFTIVHAYVRRQKEKRAEFDPVFTRISELSVSIADFYKKFINALIQQVQSSDQLSSASIKEKHIIAEDAFNRIVYTYVQSISSKKEPPKGSTQSVNESRASRRTALRSLQKRKVPSSVIARPEDNHIAADDSVSVAESEVISMRSKRESDLNANLLSLHNSSRSRSSKVPMPQDFRSNRSRKSRASTQRSKKISDIVIDVNTESTRGNQNSRSKFSRSPSRRSKRAPVPSFFDTEVSRRPRESVATRRSQRQ